MTKKIIIIATVILILMLGTGLSAFLWIQSQLEPVVVNAPTQQFVVGKGQALIQTALKLHEQGLIRNPQVFRYYVQYMKLDTKIQAGSYDLSPSMSAQEIALTLTEGTEDIWITIPEGWRKEEIAGYLATQDLTQFDAEVFLDLSATSEGQLFPDTYLVPKESTPQYLYSLLTNTYKTKVTSGLTDSFEASSLSPEEVLVLASIVEREGKGYENMRHVAGVLINRIDAGMPLQADATLQYINGIDDNGKWWSAPTIDLKQSTSPYNTYMYPGLPPRPIANPGLDAIRAVLDPLPTDDLFYIHAPSGESYFAETLEEHNANVNKYLR